MYVMYIQVNFKTIHKDNCLHYMLYIPSSVWYFNVNLALDVHNSLMYSVLDMLWPQTGFRTKMELCSSVLIAYISPRNVKWQVALCDITEQIFQE